MDKATLVGPGIAEGRKFLELLHEDGVKISAALWQRDDVRCRWTLDLFTPLVDEIGLRETFRRLTQTLEKSPDRPAINTLDVYLYGAKDDVYKRLRRQYGRAQDKYVEQLYLGNHLMEEGYIYFIK